MKNFTKPKQRAALRRLHSPSPTRSKLPTPLEQRFSSADLQEYKNIYFPSTAWKVSKYEGFSGPPYLDTFHVVKCFENAFLGRLEMMQCKCFFLYQLEKGLLENLSSE